MKNIHHYAIIIGTMAMMQWHSSEFWASILDGNIIFGWITSIMVELTALYFWYVAKGTSKSAIATYFLAVIISSIVASTATIKIAKQNFKNTEVAKQDKVMDEQLKAITRTLDSIKEKDYPMTIQKTLATMSTITEKKHSVSKDIKFIDYINVALIAGVMYLSMIAQIIATRKLRRDEVVEHLIQRHLKQEEHIRPKEQEHKEHRAGTEENITSYSSKALLAQEVAKKLNSIKGNMGNISMAKLMELFGEHRNIWNKLQATMVDGVGGIGEEKINTIKEKASKVQVAIKNGSCKTEQDLENVLKDNDGERR